MTIYSQTITRHPICTVIGQYRSILEYFLSLIKVKPFFHSVKIKHISLKVVSKYLYGTMKKFFQLFCCSCYFLKKKKRAKNISRVVIKSRVSFIHLFTVKLHRKLLNK